MGRSELCPLHACLVPINQPCIDQTFRGPVKILTKNHDSGRSIAAAFSCTVTTMTLKHSSSYRVIRLFLLCNFSLTLNVFARVLLGFWSITYFLFGGNLFLWFWNTEILLIIRSSNSILPRWNNLLLQTTCFRCLVEYHRRRYTLSCDRLMQRKY